MKNHNARPVTFDNINISPPRDPETDDEKVLIKGGWTVEGMSWVLFSHPIFGRKVYRIKEALELNDSVKDKCSVCGMCADAQCCPPIECKCLYGKLFVDTFRLNSK